MALSDRLSALSPEQRALFERLREQQKKEKSPTASPAAAPKIPQPPPVLRRDPGERWPLSFDQERLWFLYMLNPEDTAYNIDTGTRIRGPLDFAALEGAFQEIARRHEIWRTVFPAVDGVPVQVVLPEMVLPTRVADLRSLPMELREPVAFELMVQETRRPFRLETGPLVRALLVRLADDDCLCHLTVHHIVTDWVTFQLFWKEIGLLYETYVAGRPSPLPEPVVQFADYAVWQREWMSGEVEQFFLRYWVDRLRDAPLSLDLPTDRPRPVVQTSRGDQIEVRVERAAELKSVARREGLTPFMAVLAAYQMVLSRFSGQEKVIVGSPNANRNRVELQETFGFFLTQLPFCADFSGNPTLREALRRVRDTALGAYAHQDLPFGKLVAALQPERDLSRAPIVQVILLLLDGAVLSPKLADLAVETVNVHDGNARYDVMFGMWDHPDLIHGGYEFNRDLWDRTTAERLVEAFLQIIEEMIEDPDRRLNEVELLSPAARHQVLVEWNDTRESLEGLPVPRLLAARALEHPEALAVEGEDGEAVTYGGLQHRAGRIVARLRHLGVGHGDRVGVCLGRTPDLVAALLGVWHAGAAYVPLDPGHPAERLRLILEDAGVAALIADAPSLPSLGGGLDVPLLRFPLEWMDAPEPGPVEGPAAEDAAYVLFTSGSTGRPKGVEVSHRSLSNLLRSLANRYGVGPGDACLAVTTVSFDIAALEIFLPLVTGGRVLLASRETASDGTLLARALEERGATVLQATPATWRLLADSGWTGKPGLLRLSGGEALSRDLAGRLLSLPGGTLWNQYGPTETTIWSTVQRVDPQEEGPAVTPIGAPLANTTVRLVGRDLSLVPLGTIGELCLGGTGVARGYLGRPELTAERFLPDPFSAAPGARLYRTGDLARWLADGRLEFLGRTDHQVKLRGFRIELGEIEAALRSHPGVAEAVVLLQRVAEEGRLLGVVVPASPEASPEAAELRAALRESLPDYMVPAAFATVAALPLTPSGKVDRAALERLTAEVTTPGGSGSAPEGPDEERIASLWAEVLGVERVGARDDFFALGGHSLLATRLVFGLREAFGVDLPVRAVFQAPTVAAQAELISGHQRGRGTPSDSIRPLERAFWPLRASLSFSQERLWFLDRLTPGSPAYNLPLALRLEGPLDAGALAAAIRRLVERHETLRTSFPEPSPEDRGRPVQEIAVAGAIRLQEIDLSAAADPEAEVRRLAEADALRPFDLTAGPLLRATLLRLATDRHVLLVTLHHIVSDAWSMGVLVEDLAALYAGRPLAELPVQYADWAVWQRGRLTSDEIDRQLAFWRDQLAGAPRVLDLPTDHPRPAVQSQRGGTVLFAVEPELTAALNDLAGRAGATLYMVLLTGWGALLGRLAGERDVVVGTAIANRDRPEVERLIGFFVNTLALRVDLSGAPSFSEALGDVRHRVLEAFAHRDMPFEKLVEELHPARDRSRQPVFQVMLTFQNVPRGRAELPGLNLTPVEVEGKTTKLDLTLTLVEEGGGVTGWLEYAGDLFERATVERWTGTFRRLLAGAAAAPGARVSEIPLLAEEERLQVLVEWNRTEAPYPRQAALGDLFTAQAARTPDASAISWQGPALTYRELERRSARVASRLLTQGLVPEERVGLVADRSPDLVAAILGVLRAGGAYMPLEPDFPAERLAWMLRDAGVRRLIADRRLLAALSPAALPPGLDLLPLDDLVAEGVTAEPAMLPSVPAEALAYVMYTSGSTGTPKGVAVTHRNVARLVQGSDFAAMGPDQVWLMLAPVSFDLSTLEIWAPLLNGGRLALAPPGRTSLDDLAEAIRDHGVTSLWLTSGLFHQMVDRRLDGLRPLRQLLAGGDVVSAAHARRALEAMPGLVLIDGYGPTEGTTFTSCHRMTDARQVGTSVPIGVPITNTRTYVLDEELHPVPVGVAGELYAGGDGVARGYLGRPDLTAERFVPDAFSGSPGGLPGERLYRTGDRVRWRVDGVLEFLGRLDGQVKIRGFRVEPEEVETALARHPAVRQAAVLPRESGPQGKVLAAYVTLSAPVETAELQRFLRERLPEAMVPSAWLVLEEIPLTRNGKVDRRALGGMDAEVARSRVEHVAPRTSLEEILVEAAAGVLGMAPERIGVHDNFFDLGGHSLLATQLVAQLRHHHGVDVPLQLLFETTSLAELADRITDRELAEVDAALLEEMMAEMEEAD